MELEELQKNNIDVVLKMDENPEDGDTDTEVCNDAATCETELAQITEVLPGLFKIQTSQRATKETKRKSDQNEKKSKTSQEAGNVEE